MSQRIQALRAACTPFVTRALRGRQRRRFTLAAGLVALAVLLLGAWVGLSPDRAARDARYSLGMEPHLADRTEAQYIISVDTQREQLRARREVDRSLRDPGGSYRYRLADAWVFLDAAVNSAEPPPPRALAMQQRARRLRDAHAQLDPRGMTYPPHPPEFDWSYPPHRERLQSIVEAELRPTVEIYRSPLGVMDTVRIIGGMAGGLLLLILTVLAPLWIGVRLAQELHDNTLMPLTGTALTARQLTIGLVVGPLSPLAIVAAPLVMLTLGAAVIAGRVAPALGMLLTTAAAGSLLAGLAMLVALTFARRRSPGLVGIGLLSALGLLAMVGAAAGTHLTSQALGVVNLLPSAGVVHLLGEAFHPVTRLRADDALALDLRLLLATVSMVVLAGLTLRAIERWIAGTHRDGALRPAEAGAAAIVLAMLAVTALPFTSGFGETVLLANGMLLVPLALLLVSRLPGGDVPAALRPIPIRPRLTEFFAWWGAPLVVALVVADPIDDVPVGLPIGLIHLGWSLVVIALVTIRGTALPTTILAKLWLGLGVAVVLVEYWTGVAWCIDNSPSAEMLFPLFMASPVLGVVQLGLFVWIPLSLVQSLRPASARHDSGGPGR